MNTWKAMAAAVWMGLPVAAEAQSSPVVVELFTSQGCSSCPPADALLHRMTERADVLPLALHVDYWDYIGWKDQFADPSHTARQKGYAQAAGRNMIYTPQMIIMGQQDVVGADAVEVAEAIARQQQNAPSVELQLQRSDTELQVVLRPLADLPSAPLLVQLVRFSPVKSIAITRGELAGRKFDYVNVVEDWQQIGTWDGQGELSLNMALAGPEPAAVLVQQGAFGAILAAARAD